MYVLYCVLGMPFLIDPKKITIKIYLKKTKKRKKTCALGAAYLVSNQTEKILYPPFKNTQKKKTWTHWFGKFVTNKNQTSE